jgi:hypothetical protein
MVQLVESRTNLITDLRRVMKQLSKIMLAAVSSVCIAAPAFAWDFNASGSGTAKFNVTNTTANTGANAITSGGFASEGGALTLSSSNTDGAKSLGLSYSLDWDGNLDETIALSGSNKVGDWTGSADVSYNRGGSAGCSNAASDNGSGSSVTAAVVSCGATGNPQGGEDTMAITLTNGTMTIKLGDAGHLSNQNVSSGSVAAGQRGFEPSDADLGVGAFVDGFHGVSLGYKISDAMNVTVAYQKVAGSGDMLGTGTAIDNEETAMSNSSTEANGLSFSGDFGIAAVGLTVASGATADAGGVSVAAVTNTTSMSTTGLGVKIDLGDIKPFISYGSYKLEGSQSKKVMDVSGSEFGTTYNLGSDTITLLIGSVTETETAENATTAGETETFSAMELGYSTTAGPATLGVGYGTLTRAQTDGALDGYSMSDIEVSMTMSF